MIAGKLLLLEKERQMKEFDIKDYIGDISAAEAKSDILEKIKYDKRNLIDNTEGHSFTAPNGWKFKASLAMKNTG